jgi:hypothetical protein
MKINVELDITWLNEDNTLDEQIKGNVIREVAKQVAENVNNESIKSMAKLAQESIDTNVSSLMEEFLSQPFQERDRWGDPVGKEINIKELLKSKLDTMMTDNVDDNGKLTNYNGKPRYQSLINKELERTLNKFQDDLSKQVVNAIKDDINQKARDRITNAILTDYDLKKLVK